MLRKVLIGLAVLIVLLLLSGFLLRDVLFFALMASRIAPESGFDLSRAPAAPAYGDPSSWAALPSFDDPSDEAPSGFEVTPLPVSVFFVHPTSYMKPDNWNQPLDDEDANWVVDERVLRHQASIFNGCCEVWAPRYRQATFFSFMDRNGDGARALDLAYADVSAAFDAFLAGIDGQPFILAGHSQGTAHAARLLRERIAGTALASRLVAAYLVGFSIGKDQTGGVPACDHAAAVGCVVGWNSVDGDAGGLFPDAEGLICTNPLTWEDDGAYAGNDLNRGGIGYPSYGRPLPDEDYRTMIVEPGVADAECRRGVLSVGDLRSADFPSRMPGSSMHVYDYSLFYANVRNNALTRAQAYLAARSGG
ncbi:MAG: DUF3089 domain-containing protein [Pseudomonadales bacterium]